MTQPRATLGGRLRDLALALLNATLLLAVLLVFGTWLLLGRIQDFAAQTVGAVAETVGDDLRDRLEMQTARISDALARVNTLDERLVEATNRITTAPMAVDQAASQELAGLRDDLKALNTALDNSLSGATAPELAETRARLSTLERRVSAQLHKTRDGAQSIDSQAAAEIEGLRTDINNLTATLQTLQTGLSKIRQETSGSLRRALQQLFLDLADRIGPPSASPPTTEG